MISKLRVAGGILDDERLSGRHGELAQGVRQRAVTARGKRIHEPVLALEPLPVGVNQCQQGDRRPEETGGHAGEPIEGLGGWGVDQDQAPQRGQTFGVAQDGAHIAHRADSLAR